MGIRKRRKNNRVRTGVLMKTPNQELAIIFRQLVLNEFSKLHTSLIHLFLALSIMMIILGDNARLLTLLIPLFPILLALTLIFFTIIKYFSLVRKKRLTKP